MHLTRLFAARRQWLLLLILWVISFAQLALAGPPVLPNPNVDFQTSGSVYALVRLADGRTLVGGSFAQVDGVPRGNLARLNADGSLDNGFVADTDGAVRALLALPDGRLFVGGDFNNIDGQNFARLALLDVNGDVDSSFAQNNALLTTTGTVYALAASADGAAVYVGGSFHNNGYNRLAKFTIADGIPVPTFQVDFATTSSVRCILPDGTGGLYIGGGFANAGGIAVHDRLARIIDSAGVASVDTSFAPVIVNGLVYSLAFDASSLYAGGSFISTGSQPPNRLARFARNTGAVDAGWNPDVFGNVYALNLSNGSLVLGGSFQIVAGQLRPRLAVIDAATGSLSSAWPAIAFVGSPVYAVAATPSRVAAGGLFRQVGAAMRLGVADFALADGALQAQPDAQVTMSGGPAALLQHPDGSLWVGGTFLTANGQPRPGLARIAADGSLDPAVTATVDGQVYKLLADAAGRVYMAGTFATVNGVPHAGLARFAPDGTLDAAFTAGVVWGAGIAQVVELVLDDDQLFLVGNFTTVGTSGGAQEAAAYVAKLDTTTGIFDSAWTPTIPAAPGKTPVQAMALDAANDALYIGGGFASVDGMPRLGVAKLSTENGDLDAAFVADVNQVLNGPNGDVWGLAFGGGFLYIGGYQFDSINGTSGYDALARVSGSSGALDAGWDAGLSNGTGAYVENLIFESPDVLIATGGFLTPNGALARFYVNAANPVDSAFAPALNDYASTAIYRATDEAIVVVGGFTRSAAEPRSGLAAFKAKDPVFRDGFE